MYEGDRKNTVISFKRVYAIGHILFSDLGPWVSAEHKPEYCVDWL